jgi:GNAT superfamily N-acetyltransferase
MILNMTMRDVTPSWREALLTLTIKDFWAMSRWVYQDGSCFTAINFDGKINSQSIDAWGCLTFEDEPWPVMGVFVRPESRGSGLASRLVVSLLAKHGAEIQRRGGYVYAAIARFPKYARLIHENGFTPIPWE